MFCRQFFFLFSIALYSIAFSSTQWSYAFKPCQQFHLMHPNLQENIYCNSRHETSTYHFSEIITFFKNQFSSGSPFLVEQYTHFDPPKPYSQQLCVHWIGHATCLIQIDGLNILTDPIFDDCYPIWKDWKLYERYIPPGIIFDQLPKIDVILISHNHYDHLDETTLLKFVPFQPQILVPKGLKNWFVKRGFKKVIEHSWWDRTYANREKLVILTALPAQHQSMARDGLATNESLWCGWMIGSEKQTIYFAGDTGFNAKMFQQIAQQFNFIDVALLPIAPYEDREMHLDPEQAFFASKLLKTKKMVPIHWGTYRFDGEKLDDPIIKIKQMFERYPDCKDTFCQMHVGQSITF